MKKLDKAILEAMKVIAPEEVKYLNRMVKVRANISDLMVREDVLGDFGTSSFVEVLKVIDYRIEDWYVNARSTVTEYLVNRHEEGDVVAHDEFKCDLTYDDFSAEDIAVKQWASGYEPEEDDDDNNEEYEYEWITTIPRPAYSKPDSDNGDIYEHLDCDGDAW